jgi:hypothetical protein
MQCNAIPFPCLHRIALLRFCLHAEHFILFSQFSDIIHQSSKEKNFNCYYIPKMNCEVTVHTQIFESWVILEIFTIISSYSHCLNVNVKMWCEVHAKKRCDAKLWRKKGKKERKIFFWLLSTQYETKFPPFNIQRITQDQTPTRCWTCWTPVSCQGQWGVQELEMNGASNGLITGTQTVSGQYGFYEI